jgi:hypothetical protein
LRYRELSLGAQTAYAELADQVQALEVHASLVGLSGAFHKRTLKGREYWYFGYRDIDGTGRMVYIGPNTERIQGLVVRFEAQKQSGTLIPQANAAIALGCVATMPKHFKLIKRLADYGMFRAGGILVGTHAFLAYGNMLGIRWTDGGLTLDVDFAHAGKNISLALPTDVRMDIHSALESLEMGLLPITQLSGRTGAQYRNPQDPELRLDFVTSMHRDNTPVRVPNLNIALEPLRFMEFSLEGTLQACLLSREGACTVNLPAPERFAVHKLIVYGERPVAQRTKATKDLLQAAALISYLMETGRESELLTAWSDASSRGPGWRKRLNEGRTALLRLAPELSGIPVVEM